MTGKLRQIYEFLFIIREQTYKSISYELSFPFIELLHLDLVVREDFRLEPDRISYNNAQIIGESPQSYVEKSSVST